MMTRFMEQTQVWVDEINTDNIKYPIEIFINGKHISAAIKGLWSQERCFIVCVCVCVFLWLCFFLKLGSAGNGIFYYQHQWIQTCLAVVCTLVFLEVGHFELWLYLMISFKISCSLNSTYSHYELHFPATSVKTSFNIPGFIIYYVGTFISVVFLFLSYMTFYFYWLADMFTISRPLIYGLQGKFPGFNLQFWYFIIYDNIGKCLIIS